MTEAIVIENVRKVFRAGIARTPVVALEHLDLRVDRGEVYGLLGPNGSGKSTAIKILLDLVRPDTGHCRLLGKPSNEPATRSRVGYVPEAPYFYGHLTGRAVVLSMGRFSGLSGSALSDSAEEVLDLVGLSISAARPIRTYSKGMLQRLGMAQALVHDPEMVILDEPTAGVDPIGSREISELIGYLKAKGKTVLLCSHLLSQVESVCDRVAILYQGRKLAEGTVAELAKTHESTELLRFGERDERKRAEEILRREGISFAVEGGGSVDLEEVFISLVREEKARNSTA